MEDLALVSVKLVSGQDNPGAMFLAKHGVHCFCSGDSFLQVVGEVGCDQPYSFLLPCHLYLRHIGVPRGLLDHEFCHGCCSL